MNAKYTLSDFSELMVASSGGDKRELDQFCKSFFALLEEVLIRDRIVKISGLGIFKLQRVVKRRSVNVRTGEAVEIPEHYKIVFQPDKELNEQVNGLFSAFESVEVDNLVLGEQELPESPPDEPEDDCLVEEDGLPEPLTEEEPMDTLIELAEEVAISKHPSVEKKQPLFVEVRPLPATPKDRPEWMVYALSFLILLLGGGGIYLALYLGGGGRRADVWTPRQVVATVDSIVRHDDLLLDTSKIAPGIEIEAANAMGDTAHASAIDDAVHANNDTIKTAAPPVTEAPRERERFDVLEKGERLTVVALRNYGNKVFWIYIYEENKDKIKSPDNVPAETRLIIPPASKYGIDPHSRESVARAQTKIDLFYSTRSDK